MRHLTLFAASMAVLLISACNSHPPDAVSPTFWELDNSSLEWGAAGNVTSDESEWTILISESGERGVLAFNERRRLQRISKNQQG